MVPGDDVVAFGDSVFEVTGEGDQDIDEKDQEDDEIKEILKVVRGYVFLGDGRVGDVSDVLEAEEETDETHPDNHHHQVEENVEVWLVGLVEVLDGCIICFVLYRAIGLLLNLLFEVKNSLNFGHNINISV